MKGKSYRRAFTIIEVMLVLAITGLLFVGLIGGVQATIRKQRYNDSVQSFENTLQEQYDLVSSVQNSRDLAQRIRCDKSSGAVVPVTKDPGDKTAYTPGMSNCLIYGRLIEIKNNGHEIEVSNVIGLDPNEFASSAVDQKEIDTFKNALVSTERINENGAITARSETILMQWSAWLREPRTPAGAGNASTGGVIILKSPVSGTVWTYKFDGAINSAGISDKVVADNIGSRSFCVMSDDASPKNTRAVIVGGASGVFAGANSSAVQIAPLDVELNGVKPVDCT